MLYELIIVILAIMMPIMCYLSFVKGYNIGAKETDKPIIQVKHKRKMSKQAEESMERQKETLNQILLNVDNYDGTSNGQKEF